MALLATMGLATDITTVSPLTALEDTPIDVGAALGLGGATNTDLGAPPGTQINTHRLGSYKITQSYILHILGTIYHDTCVLTFSSG